LHLLADYVYIYNVTVDKSCHSLSNLLNVYLDGPLIIAKHGLMHKGFSVDDILRKLVAGYSQNEDENTSKYSLSVFYEANLL